MIISCLGDSSNTWHLALVVHFALFSVQLRALLHPNVKLSAFPQTTYKLHGTLRIQEVNAVSAKDSKTAWRRYSKHVIIYVFKP